MMSLRILITFTIFLFHCRAGGEFSNCSYLGDKDTIYITFNLDRDVYIMTHWAEPPQFAVWIENESGTEIHTLWVTNRTAKDDWEGKVECPVSLPYWVSRYQFETQRNDVPSYLHPVPDAISGATPTNRFYIETNFGSKDIWYLFIEVNVSGDFSRYYPQWNEFGEEDYYGNGQPSIIYRGKIDLKNRNLCQPILIGRTEQDYYADSLTTDLKTITTANNLIKDLSIKFLEN